MITAVGMERPRDTDWFDFQVASFAIVVDQTGPTQLAESLQLNPAGQV